MVVTTCIRTTTCITAAATIDARFITILLTVYACIIVNEGTRLSIAFIASLAGAGLLGADIVRAVGMYMTATIIGMHHQCL